jgi:hypothetical protein
MIIDVTKKTRAQIEKIRTGTEIGVTTEIIRKGERAVNVTEMAVIGLSAAIETNVTETKTQKTGGTIVENVILHPEEIGTKIENGTVETKIVLKKEENTEEDQEAALEIATVQQVKVAAAIDEASEESPTKEGTNHICIGHLLQEIAIVVTMKNEVIIVTTAKTVLKINPKKALKRMTFHLLLLRKNLTAQK